MSLDQNHAMYIKPWVMIHSDVIVDAYGLCGSGNPLPLIGGEEP